MMNMNNPLYGAGIGVNMNSNMNPAGGAQNMQSGSFRNVFGVLGRLFMRLI